MGDFEPDEFDCWRLCDDLSIKEAALPIAGCIPAAQASVENWAIEKRPSGYRAAKAAQ